MQFLANENMPMSVILHLRAARHDVLAAKESMRGETDNAILARAQAELRMIEVLDSTTTWSGRFSVVDERRIRSRPLPD